MNDLEQIKNLEEELRLAMLAGDVNKLDTLISDDLIFTDHTGVIHTKEMDLHAHRSGNLDWVQAAVYSLPYVQREQIALTGLSRNGKMALWAAAYDERIKAVIPISGGNTGRLQQIFT